MERKKNFASRLPRKMNVNGDNSEYLMAVTVRMNARVNVVYFDLN